MPKWTCSVWRMSPSGEVAARFTHKMKFDFDTRQQFDDFLRRPLHCEHQFEVAPGNYQFKVVFRSAKDRFGAVEAPLAIDPLQRGAAQLERHRPQPQRATDIARSRAG